jgi:hypothetical protein
MMVGQRIDGQSLIDEIRDEEWWKLVELKKFCLLRTEKANHGDADMRVEQAQKYMDFLMGVVNAEVTFTDSEQVVPLEGWDNDKVSRFNEYTPNLNKPDEHPLMPNEKELMRKWNEKFNNSEQPESSEHEKVLDLERIAKDKFLCWSIFIFIFGDWQDIFWITIDLDDEKECLDLGIEGQQSSITPDVVKLMPNGEIFLYSDGDGELMQEEFISNLLEPYWIDKPDVS